MPDKKPKKFNELPDVVQDYLLDPPVLARVKEISEKFSLGEDVVNPIMDEIEEIVCNQHEVSDLPVVLSSLFNLDEAKAKSLAVEVAGKILLPLSGYRQGDGEIVVGWGGDPLVFSGIPKLEIPVQTPEAFVEESLKEWLAEDPNHVLNSRMIFILSSFLKNERTEEEIRSALARPIKVGGLALGREAIDNIFQLLQERKEREGFVYSPMAVVSPATSPRPVMDDIKPVAPPPIPHPPAVAGLWQARPTPSPSRVARAEEEFLSTPIVKSLEPLHQPEDKIELAKAADVIKEKAPLAKAKTPLDEAVDSLIKACGLKFANNDLKNRFVHAIDSRLRDVRDAFEIRDLLERSVDQGGLGWSGAELVRVMEELEKAVVAQKTKWASEVEKEKQALKRAKEQEEKKRQADEEAQRKAAKPKVRPEPVAPVMSAGSVQWSGRPVVADVAFTRKLSGPIEELQNMSLSEFRRLSRHPEESATKIIDKINLLEEQGIGQRVAGVKAWRQSPVNRLYLEMNKEALMSGKKMTEVIVGRAKAGLEALSLEEVKVINEMNGGLRF